MKSLFILSLLSLASTTTTLIDAASSNSKVSFAYFTSWSIYARNYKPADIPADRISHLFYAFFKPMPDGTVALTDKWADTDIRYPGDEADAGDDNLYGNLKQLFLLKQKNRRLKVLMSVGGYTLSSDFAKIASSDAGRDVFAKSVVEKINDLGLDGVDIDWEYPASATEARNFVKLLKTVRAALDDYQRSKREQTRYLLTTAVSCGPAKYNLLPVADLAAQVDYVALMAYDFAGSWSDKTDHQARYYGGAISGQACVSYYAQNMDPSKLVLGLPAYGRSFASTTGPAVGGPFKGVGAGSWEAGVYDYKAIPLNEQVRYDWKALAATAYDAKTKELVSFDDNQVVAKKLAQVDKLGLGGAMVWELSGDRTDERGLINTVYRWAGPRLEASRNHLSFPQSSYGNIRRLSAAQSGTRPAAKKAAPGKTAAKKTSAKKTYVKKKKAPSPKQGDDELVIE